MNIDNENIDPVTDLGLALGYSSRCVQRRLNNDSGAGANAGSGLNMTFVNNNPLSELVWSPHKGLSLKRADSSFVDTKTSLFWGAGPSNVALLPAQGSTGRKSATDIHVGGENLFLTSNTSLHMTSEVAGVMPVHGPRSEDEAGEKKIKQAVKCRMENVKILPSVVFDLFTNLSFEGLRNESVAGTGGDAEEINTARGATVMNTDQKEEIGGASGSSEPDIAKTTETAENQFSTLPGPVNRKSTDILSIKFDHIKPDEALIELLSTEPIGGDFNVISEAHHMNEPEALADHVGNQIFQGGRKSYEKIELTAENDLQNLKSESANDTTVRLEFSPEVGGNSQQDEDTPPTSKTASAQHSPTNSRVREKRRKGKEKALSDVMMPKDDDDSHESVESCNSAGLFPTGKRRRTFEEDLVVGTKGSKKQIHGSTSFTRQDSSFMNWISNVMKGFSQSVQNEAPYPLSIARPDDGHENLDKKLFTNINKNQDSGSKIIGFHSIFQSLYCGKTEVQETRMLNVEYQVEGSKSSNKMSNSNSTPRACQEENSNLVGKQVFLLNERFNESTSVNGEGSAIQPEIPLDKLTESQEKGNTNSEENRSKCQLVVSSKEKERTSSNSSLGKRKTSSAELADSGLPSAGKTTSKFCQRNDSLGSIWITRFTANIPSSSANPDHLNPSADLSPKRSLESLKMIPHAQNHIGSHVDGSVFDARDRSTGDPLGKEFQNSLTGIKSHDDTNSMYKLTPVLPFPKLNHSDAMASVFARRLDALKHITSSRVTSDTAHATATCFFCGVKGHDLRDCSEITQIELKELLRNLNACSGIEELPCLCIRCFQRSHWAIACSNKCLRVESNASFGEMQLSTGNKESSKLQSGKDSRFHTDVSHKFSEEMRTEKDFNTKVDEIVDFQKKTSSTSPVKKLMALGSEENMSKGKRIMPLSFFVGEQNSVVPHGLFDTVKKLRLSRSDIMKWKNSQMSLSQLDGFFLRLRLGKWEEGLGGTGYHVACIIGSQGDNKSQDAKSSMLVKVGGMKCLVDSRYVSNHDFLEDELMAWWSITSRNGDKIPSEEDLGVKVKNKRMLGF